MFKRRKYSIIDGKEENFYYNLKKIVKTSYDLFVIDLKKTTSGKLYLQILLF